MKLERVSEIDNLEIRLDIKLTFRSHIIVVAIRFALLSFSNDKLLIVNTINILYFFLAMSKLEYASCIWIHKTYISRLEKVQNKFFKYYFYKIRFIIRRFPMKIVTINKAIQYRFQVSHHFTDHSLVLGKICINAKPNKTPQLREPWKN